MKVNNFNYHAAIVNLIRLMGDNPDKVVIYTTCDHVSKSGISRNIKAFIIKSDEIYNLGYGRVNGCGMDMGFHVAETIFRGAYTDLKYQDILSHRWV